MELEPMIRVFARRKDRFRVLDTAISLAGWKDRKLSVLEVGCSFGDAAAHLAENGMLDITAIDINRELIAEARVRYSNATRCHFICSDACAMPFDHETFDGIYSEAAFSVIPDKTAAAAEYARVLRRGGRVIINDFARRSESSVPIKVGIPCMDGSLTIDGYRAAFSQNGFFEVESAENFFEFTRIFSLVCQEYGIKPGQVGDFLTKSFGNGAEVPPLTYCRMIFEKE